MHFLGDFPGFERVTQCIENCLCYFLLPSETMISIINSLPKTFESKFNFLESYVSFITGKKIIKYKMILPSVKTAPRDDIN